MTYNTLISAQQLQSLLGSNQPFMVFDCSYDLVQPDVGRTQFEEAHIPGALHVSLDTDLSVHGAHAGESASGGRHPLPSRERFAQWLSNIGFRNDMQAVIYDRQGGLFSGRMWWMLQWAGHHAAAVLDGGLGAWQAIGGAVSTGPSSAGQHPTGTFALQPSLRALVSADDVLQRLSQPEHQTVIDARAAARFRGDVEPLDPVAGHIPGALNRPFTDNLALDGRFKPKELLHAEFAALLQGKAPHTVVHQCGSGVSALSNLLAMEIAGFGASALYAGSWSDWCSVADRPMAKG